MRCMKVLLFYGSNHMPQIMIENLRFNIPGDIKFETVEFSESFEKKIEKLRDADFVVVYPPILSRMEVEASVKAKMIQLISAGYDGVDVQGATIAGIPVANNGGANSIAVAEHTIMLILSIYKKLILHHNSLKRDVWLGHSNVTSMYELTGKNIGIIGLGNIGREFAKRVKGLQTKVFYHDIERFERFEKEWDIQYLPLDELLSVSDIITVHVPLNKATRGLIGERELAFMKRTAVLINTSRGGIVEEKALYDALKNDRIAFAGLDVFQDEEAIRTGRKKLKLLELGNVIVTPHCAGATYDTWFRRIENVIENIKRVKNGNKPNWVINKSVLKDE